MKKCRSGLPGRVRHFQIVYISMYTLTLILSYSKLRMKSWQVCAYLHRQQKENGGIYMKYRLGAVLLSAAIVTSLAGCQETPDEEIVRQKTDIEQAETVAQDEFENVKKQVAAPDEYKASLEDPTGSLKVTVDAPVTVPDVQGIKLMTVKARTYTQADMDAVYKTVMKETELWTRNYGSGLSGMTKSEIEEQIVNFKSIKERIASGDETIKQLYERMDLDASIEECEAAYADAPETPQTEIVEPKIQYDEKAAEKYANKFDVDPEPADNKDGGGEETGEETEGAVNPNFFYANFSVDGRTYSAAVSNNLSDEYKWIYFDIYCQDGAYQRPFSNVELQNSKPMEKSPDELKQNADTLMQELGFTDMAFSAGDIVLYENYSGVAGLDGREGDGTPKKQGYMMYYTRMVDGIPVIYTPDEGTYSEMSSDSQFSPVWAYERISLTYDDEGLAAFEWMNPYEISESSNENVYLMPFSEIQKIFENMIINKYTSDDKEKSRTDMRITDVRLSYMRVREKDNLDEGKLIPVWDFFGSRDIYQDGGTEPYTEDQANMSFLTVNAMDGTIIERNRGY